MRNITFVCCCFNITKIDFKFIWNYDNYVQNHFYFLTFLQHMTKYQKIKQLLFVISSHIIVSIFLIFFRFLIIQNKSVKSRKKKFSWKNMFKLKIKNLFEKRTLFLQWIMKKKSMIFCVLNWNISKFKTHKFDWQLTIFIQTQIKTKIFLEKNYNE